MKQVGEGERALSRRQIVTCSTSTSVSFKRSQKSGFLVNALTLVVLILKCWELSSFIKILAKYS